MNKRLLKTMPIIEPKVEWMNLFEQLKDTNIFYLVAVQEKIIENDALLILNFYDKSCPNKVDFRVFINKKDYITQDFNYSPMKWRVASLQNLVGWTWYNRCVLVDNDSINILNKFLGITEKQLQEIDILQNKIMASRLTKKHEVIKNRIDNKMSMVSNLPKDFESWIDDTALYHSRYIYYKYKARKKLDGYCTHCKTDVKVEGARHNKNGVCPNCNSPIIYKATGMSKNVVDYSNAALIQKVNNNLLVRYFSITKSYKKDYRDPKLTYIELARDFYNEDGKIDEYEWDNFKQTGEIRWCDTSYRFDFSSVVLYEKNLNKVLKGTKWQYSAIKEFATHKKGFRFPVWRYLSRYSEFPALEYLVKLKLYRLTSDILYYYGNINSINLSGENLFEVLGLDKTQLSRLQRINADIKDLQIIKSSQKANLKLTDEQILFIAKNLRIENVIRIAKYTTVHQILKYIQSQSQIYSNINDALNDWKDYLDDCEILKYDLKNSFILFPKNLKKAHDRTYKLIEKNRNELISSKIREMYDKLFNTFNWEYKNSVIVVPKTPEEIIREGQVLHHCVGGYVEKVAKGKTIILFLRNKDAVDKPFYTIEIDPVNFKIIQCRGKNNSSMTEDVKKIINRFNETKLNAIGSSKAA